MNRRQMLSATVTAVVGGVGLAMCGSGGQLLRFASVKHPWTAGHGQAFIESVTLDGEPQVALEAKAGEHGWVERFVDTRSMETERVSGHVVIRIREDAPEWAKREMLAMWGAA